MKVLIGNEYPKNVIPLIESAKRNIDIIVYDWRWYPDQVTHPVQQFNMALVRAVQRGVIVRAVINAHTILEQLKKVGIKARQLGDKRTLHSKIIMIDNSTLVIGSHNFTRNAFVSNIESSIVVEIPSDVTRFDEFFRNLYGL